MTKLNSWFFPKTSQLLLSERRHGADWRVGSVACPSVWLRALGPSLSCSSVVCAELIHLNFWLQILHSQISTIEKQATTATGCHLLIRCKNFQLLQLVIPQERDCHDVYISLVRLARPGKAETPNVLHGPTPKQFTNHVQEVCIALESHIVW